MLDQTFLTESLHTRLKDVHKIPSNTHLMKSLHHAHHIVEDDDGLTLAQSLLFYDIVLEVN